MSISQALTRKVFRRNGLLFTSLTSDYLPEIPRPLVELDYPYLSLESCQKPIWVDPRYYCLAYTPVSPRYEKPFDVLKIPKNISVNRVACGGGNLMYRTPPILCKALIQLEVELLEISAILSQHITLIGPEFRRLQTPASYGYRDSHKTPKYALTAIKQSRDAFVMLMAWLSYLITIHDRPLVDAKPGEPDFRTWEHMLCEGGIPQDRVQELKNSEINDFDPSSYPRAGVFVRYDDRAFHQTMKLCIKNKIPVWVGWGGKEPWTPEAAILDHLPTPQECVNARDITYAQVGAARRLQEAAKEEAALQRASSTDSNPWCHGEASSARSTSQNAGVPKIPAPHSGSRQKYGETPAQFLKRIGEARVRRMASESADQRQRREAREQAQKDHPLPGRSSKAPLVFHWEEDEKTGVRMRTQVYRNAVDQFWDSYSNRQRHFDSYYNEWDVCTEFDPEAKYPDGDSDDDADDFYMGNTIDPQPIPPSPPISILPATMTQVAAPALPMVSSTASDDNSVDTLVSAATMTQVVAPALPMASSTASDDNSVDTLVSPATMTQVAAPALPMILSTTSDDNSVDTLYPVVFVGGLLDLLYERYGFLVLVPDANTEYINTLNWRATLSILGLTSDSPRIRDLHANDDIRNDHIREAVSHFVECMLFSYQTMPAALCDIHPQSTEPLELNPHLRIFTRKTGLKDDASSAKVYFVQSVDCSDGTEVMLRDAATVLECYRQFKKLEDVITFLFINGRPFYMFVPQACIPPPQPIRIKHSPTLGYYPKDYKPGLREYRFYEQLRQEFCNLPRGRAALTRGHIIWRLALESIGAPAEEIVRNGPSQEVFTHGISIEDPLTVLWDDELSDAEKDLMCGVYHVFTGT